jgi:cytochrome b561
VVVLDRVRLRNGEHGYGLVTKTLHWLIAGAIAVQFTIGYLLEVGGGQGRGRGRGGESGRGRGRGGEIDDLGDDTLLAVHVALGVTILALAVLRLIWRRTTPLPPWAPTLSKRERTLTHRTETALYALMFLIPITGLLMVFTGDHDLLPAHIVTHIAFFVAISVHVGLVAKHQLINRDGLLYRML